MVSASMLKHLRNYADVVHPFPEQDAFFFPAAKGRPMTLGNVYKNFRRFLWQAGISHTGDGTLVHDFRHTKARVPTESLVGTREGPDGNAASPQDLYGS